MPADAYHESLWESVPEGMEPHRFQQRRAFLLERVQPGERVLDVGCGEGLFTAELVDAGARTVGVDVAEVPLARGRARARALDLRLIEPHATWPFEDSSFDVVWAGEVLEHVLDTAGWLSEVRRVLRSGGRLLLSTPDHGPLSILGLALRPGRFDAHFDPRSDHLRFYTSRTLRVLLEDFGFGPVEIHGTGGFPGARSMLLAEATRRRF